MQAPPLLFFASDRPGGIGSFDNYVSQSFGDGSLTHARLVPELSIPAIDLRASVRFDGLEVVLFSDRLGSLGGFDLWTATRGTVFNPWSIPTTLYVTTRTTQWAAERFSADFPKTDAALHPVWPVNRLLVGQVISCVLSSVGYTRRYAYARSREKWRFANLALITMRNGIAIRTALTCNVDFDRSTKSGTYTTSANSPDFNVR